MTQLLNRAIQEVTSLPESLQDEVARRILADLEGERKWDAALAASPDLLEKLADEALADYREGRTVEMGIDEL